MPRMEIAPVCLKCMDVREGWACCDAKCSYGEIIDAVFGLCYQNGVYCRHVQACQSDPRECGYWSHLEYPVEV